jgi:hypothetical protein
MRRTLIAIAGIAAFGIANMVIWATLASEAQAYSCMTTCTQYSCFTNCY